MVDTPDTITTELEVDASQAEAAAKRTAAEYKAFLGILGDIESRLGKIYNTKLPDQLRQLRELVTVLQSAPNVSAEFGRMARQSAQGVGSNSANRNTVIKGAVGAIRDNAVSQGLLVERELLKVDRERLEIFKRVRAAAADDTSGIALTRSYREALRLIGAMPAAGTAAYKQWQAQTLDDVRRFEKVWTDEATKASQARATVEIRAVQSSLDQEMAARKRHQAEIKALFQKDMGAIFTGKTPEERAALAQQSVSNLKGYAGRRGLTGFDETQLMSVYNDAEAQRFVRDTVRTGDAAEKAFALQAKQRAEAERLNAEFDQRELSRRERFHANYERTEANFMNRQFDAEQKARERKTARDVERKSGPGIARRLENRIETAAEYGAIGLTGYAATQGVKNVIDLQTAMKQLQAITQGTNSEMAVLQGTVFKVGNSTNFATKEIAEAATVLGQAGYSAAQINGSLPAVAKLATGAGAGLTEAANVVTSILSVYNMSVDQTATISNQLTQALNGSKLDFQQLTLGIQYAANSSADAGVSFEEMTAALGAMSNAGIKSGSTLGTGLRNIIEQLENPSDKFTAALTRMGLTAADVDIKSVGLQGALQVLSENGFTAADSMDAFGIRAGGAYAALKQNLDVMGQLESDMAETNAATDAAAVQMDSLAAQVTRAGNAFTQFATVAGGPFLGMMQALFGSLADVTTAASQAGPVLQLIFSILASLVASSAIVWLGKLALAFVGAGLSTAAFSVQLIASTLATEGVAAALGIASAAAKGLWVSLGPIGWTVLGLTTLFTGLSFVLGRNKATQEEASRAIDKARTASNQAAAEVGKYQSRVEEISTYIEKLTNQHERLTGNTNLAGQAADTAAKKFGDWGLEMDAAGRNVDGLIDKLIKLRGQMAAQALEQEQIRRSNLVDERDALAKKNLSSQGTLRGAAGLTIDSGQVGGELKNLLGKLRAGTLSPDETLSLASEIRKELERNPRSRQRNNLESINQKLGTSDALRSRQIDRTLGDNKPVATLTLAASKETQGFQRSGQNYVNYYNAQVAAIGKEKDPDKKLALSLGLQDWVDKNVPILRAKAAEVARAARQDPTIRAGVSEADATNQLLQLGDAASAMFQAANPRDLSTDPKILASRSKLLDSQAAMYLKGSKSRGKGTTDATRAAAKQRYLETVAQQTAVKKRLLEVKYADEDPRIVNELITNEMLGGENDTTRSLMTGGGGARGDRAATQTAKTLAAQIKDIEREIATTVSQLDVNAVTTPNGSAGLRAMVEKRNQMMRERIGQEARGSGASDSELQDRLDAFESEAKEFSDKILKGTLQDALDQLAKTAKRQAEDGAAASANRLRGGRGNLDVAITQVAKSYDDALNAQLAASAAKFEAVPGSVGEELEASRQIKAENAAARVKAVLQQLDSFIAGEAEASARAIQKAQIQDDRKRGSIAALSNAWGQLNLSDVQRARGAQEGRNLDIADQRRDVSSAQNALAGAQTRRSGIMNLLNDAMTRGDSQDVINDLGNQLNEANTSVETLERSLESASENLRAMTSESATFATFGEAASASWSVFAEQVQLTRPAMEVVADGLVNVFGTVQSSFGTLVSDVLSGTRSMGSAFKAFTVSIFQALMDLAAQIVAKQILLFVLQMFSGSSLTKSASNLQSFAAPNASLDSGFAAGTRNYLGGYQRMQKGGAAPNRDSIHALLQPGEGILNKSAMSIVGEDTLNTLNSAGNRRIDAMPTVAQVMPRLQPSETNVWVVAPDQQPTLGANDVLAIIGNDIMTGGKSKQLIKAVQQGAV